MASAKVKKSINNNPSLYIVGQTYEDGATYMGRWRVSIANVFGIDDEKNVKGWNYLCWRGLGPREYDLFVAPEDMKGPNGKIEWAFEEAAKQVGLLKNWHGRDGIWVENDVVLFDAMLSGRYQGQWFVPPVGIQSIIDPSSDQYVFFKEGTVMPQRRDKPLFAKNAHFSDDGYWTSTYVQESSHNGAPRSRGCRIGLADGDTGFGRAIDEYLVRPTYALPVANL